MAADPDVRKTTLDVGDVVAWRRRRQRGNDDGPWVGCGRSQEIVKPRMGPRRVRVAFGMHGERWTVDVVLVWS